MSVLLFKTDQIKKISHFKFFLDFSPANLTQFKWGFIQQVQGELGHIQTPSEVIMWSKNSPKGTTVQPPKQLTYDTIPATPKINDSTLGHQLYSSTTPNDLGKKPGSLIYDTPMAKPYYVRKEDASDGTKADVAYDIQQDQKWNLTFTVTLVVFHNETQQYIALRQREWTLAWDTKNAGPWIAQPAANELAPLTKPSDARDASRPRYTIPIPSAEKASPMDYPFLKKS